MYLFLLLAMGYFEGQAQKSQNLSLTLSLKMADGSGNNGAGVAWHSREKKYYAAFAGNSEFPLCVFNESGKLLSPDDLTTKVDVRGVWFNSKSGKIEVNGYNDEGWKAYELNASGIPVSVVNILEGMHQPDAQSAGSIDAKKSRVYFMDHDGNAVGWSYPGGIKSETITLHLGQTSKKDGGSVAGDAIEEKYNTTSIIYTGSKNAEFAVLNFGEGRIEMYSRKTGYMTRMAALPAGSPDCERLNFAYTNGIFFLFDKDTRTWMGYR